MKYVLALFLILFSVGTASAESVYERVMRTGELRCGYFTWPPFLAKDPNSGAITGLSAEYIEKIGDILDLKIVWAEEVGVGDYIAGLNANRFDLMCMTLWPDAGRLRNSLMSRPIFYSGVYAIVRKDDHRFDQGFEKLNDSSVTISVIDGDITQTIAEKKFPKAKRFEHSQMSDLSAHTQSVVTGKTDAIFIDYGSFLDYEKSNPDTLRILKDLGPVQIFPEMLAVKNGEIELKMLLDNVIDTISADDFVFEALKQSTSSSYPNAQPFDLQKGYR